MIYQAEGPTTRCVASFVVLALVLAEVNCSAPIMPLTPPSPTTAAAVPLPVFGHRIKTSGCQARGALPDRHCTPGAIMAGVSKDWTSTIDTKAASAPIRAAIGDPLLDEIAQRARQVEFNTTAPR